MKKFVTLLVILVMSLGAALAQSAAKLNYQAVVRSSDNHLASNETVNVTIDIKVGGSTVYTETHAGVSTNINGLLNLVIGESATPHTGDFTTIDWANATIDATIVWGSNTVTTSNPVHAVPFALSANVNCSAVVDCVDDAIENPTSTTNLAIDTVIENHLAPYLVKNCEDVNNCVETAIGNSTSNINNAIDTVIENHLTPYQIKNCGDVTDCVNSAIADGGSETNNAIDTVIENHLTPYQIKNCGDVTDCVNSAIADGSSTTNHAIDTVVRNIVHDSLVPYTIKNCADVVGCVKSEIEDGGSDLNHTIDTLVANNIHDSLVNYTIKNCDDVMACPDIQNMRDSIQINHDEIEHLTTDLNTLETRVETFNTHVCDSIKDCVAAQISDSLNTNIRPNYYTKSETYNKTEVDALIPTVNNSTITFHQEGSTDQTITLNQSTNQTITIVVPVQTSKRFTATASQTAFALTVPSGKALDAANYLVQMYINGDYVGDTVDGVVTISGNTAQYQAANNGNYDLMAGDRIQFVYWVK